MRPVPRTLQALLLGLAVAACGGTGPRPIALGEDACGYCRMEITDARFAAQVVTRTGRVHVFDSVECLVGYVQGAEAGTVRTVWVTDLERPGTFIEAETAGYLQGSDLRGPMGSTVAFASLEAARAAQARYGGTAADWTTVRAAAAAAHGGH